MWPVPTERCHTCKIRPDFRLCCCLLAQSCPTLCSPMDCRPPGFSVHGILQARTLEWVAMPFSRGSSRPRDGTHALAGGFFTTEPPAKPSSHFHDAQDASLESAPDRPSAPYEHAHNTAQGLVLLSFNWFQVLRLWTA